MSGRKCSEFRLERERAEKLELIQRINNHSSEIKAIQKSLSEALASVSAGLRNTFASEIQNSRRWLDGINIPDTSRFSVNSNVGDLRSTVNRFSSLVTSGRNIRENLMVALNQKADAMGKRLAQEVSSLESLYISVQELLGRWFGEGDINRIEKRIEEVKKLLDEEQYSTLKPIPGQIIAEINEKAKKAEELEDKHQKRLYLLKALRSVCEEMGFNEISAPKYERQGDRSSTIIYEVDTLGKGEISFAIRLDGISSFSEITDDKCFEEFDQISDFLEDQYGIHTEFQLVDGPPRKRIEKGALDLPTSGARKTRSASSGS